MRISKIICSAVVAMWASTVMYADETVIVSDILGPEGPLYVDGNLYYVGWVSHTFSKMGRQNDYRIESFSGLRP